MAKLKGRGILKAVHGKIAISVRINGWETSLQVGAGEYLLDVLRRGPRLNGLVLCAGIRPGAKRSASFALLAVALALLRGAFAAT